MPDGERAVRVAAGTGRLVTDPRHRHPAGARAVRQPKPRDIRRQRTWWSVLLADLVVLAAVAIAVFGPRVAPHVDEPRAEQLPTVTGHADGQPPILRATTTPAAGPLSIPTIGPSVVLDPDTGSMVTRTRARPAASTSTRSTTSSRALPGLPQLTTPPPPPATATVTSTSASTSWSTSTTTVTETTARDCADPDVECACDLDPFIDCAGNVRLTSTPPSTTPTETTPEVPTP